MHNKLIIIVRRNLDADVEYYVNKAYGGKHAVTVFYIIRISKRQNEDVFLILALLYTENDLISIKRSDNEA